MKIRKAGRWNIGRRQINRIARQLRAGLISNRINNADVARRFEPAVKNSAHKIKFGARSLAQGMRHNHHVRFGSRLVLKLVAKLRAGGRS